MPTILDESKVHVSFSELSVWKSCSWRHKLTHIDKVGVEKIAIHFAFGTSIHSACEAFLKGERNNLVDIFRSKFDDERKLAEEKAAQQKIDLIGFDDKTIATLTDVGTRIVTDVQPFFDATFPGWEFVDAEHMLYEKIEHDKLERKFNFKGYVDGIVRVPGKRGKSQSWIIDWKTCSFGWTREKKSDETTRLQLIYYKNFWSKKQNIDPKDVRCAFVLLKKQAKPGASCELLPVSVGDVTTERALKTLKNMLSSITKGIYCKNRGDACKYCEFKNTEHCK